jgi:hypothetical protein
MPDIMAGGMLNCPRLVKNQAASGKEWEPSAVVSIHDDLYITITKLGSSATYLPQVQVRLFFE